MEPSPCFTVGMKQSGLYTSTVICYTRTFPDDRNTMLDLVITERSYTLFNNVFYFSVCFLCITLNSASIFVHFWFSHCLYFFLHALSVNCLTLSYFLDFYCVFLFIQSLCLIFLYDLSSYNQTNLFFIFLLTEDLSLAVFLIVFQLVVTLLLFVSSISLLFSRIPFSYSLAISSSES